MTPKRCKLAQSGFVGCFPASGNSSGPSPPQKSPLAFFQLFAAVDLRGVTHSLSLASLSALESELTAKHFCIVAEGEMRVTFDATLQQFRALRESSVTSSVSNLTSLEGLNASARASLAEWVARHSLFLQHIGSVDSSNPQAIIAGLKFAVNMRCKAVRCALSGLKSVTAASPSLALLGGFTQSSGPRFIAGTLFAGTMLGQASHDLLVDRLPRDVLRRFFSCVLPDLSDLIIVFNIWREVTTKVTSPSTLDELVVEPVLLTAFVEFSVPFLAAVGVDVSAWMSLVSTSSRYASILDALRPSDLSAVRLKLLGTSIKKILATAVG